jgi:hypothetical protein
MPIQHIQDGIFFIMKPKVIQSNRLLDHPVTASMIQMPLGLQVGTTIDLQRSHGAIDQTVSHRRHERLPSMPLLESIVLATPTKN